MVKYIILNLLFFLNLESAFAVAPKASEWQPKRVDNSIVPNAVFYKALKTDETPIFLTLPTQVDSKSNFVRILNHKTLELAVDFNNYRIPTKNATIAHFSELNRLLNVNLFIDTAKDKWDIYYLSGRKIRRIATYAKTTDLSYQSLNSWLAQALSIDGIVVGANEPYILVATPSQNSNTGHQAVSISQSQSSFSMNSSKLTGGSILELDNSTPNFSVYKVIVGPTDIPLGTKIQIP